MMSWFKPIYTLYLAAVLPLLSLGIGQHINRADYGPCLSAFGGQSFLQPRAAKLCSQIFTHENMVVKKVGSDDAVLRPLNARVHRSTFRDIYNATKMDVPEAMSKVPEFDQWWARLPN